MESLVLVPPTLLASSLSSERSKAEMPGQRAGYLSSLAAHFVDSLEEHWQEQPASKSLPLKRSGKVNICMTILVSVLIV